MPHTDLCTSWRIHLISSNMEGEVESRQHGGGDSCGIQQEKPIATKDFLFYEFFFSELSRGLSSSNWYYETSLEKTPTLGHTEGWPTRNTMKPSEEESNSLLTNNLDQILC